MGLYKKHQQGNEARQKWNDEMEKLIREAADVMAEFSPGAANIYLTQPFSRETITLAFVKGFRKHSPYSLAACKFIIAVTYWNKNEQARIAAIEACA